MAKFGLADTLRNRKYVPRFYQVIETGGEVWENKKCCRNMSHRRMFPQLFRVLPNFHECFYNSIESWSTCFLFLQKTLQQEKGLQLVTFDYQNVNSLCLGCHNMNSSCQFCVLIKLQKYNFLPISMIVFLQDCFLNKYSVRLHHSHVHSQNTFQM